MATTYTENFHLGMQKDTADKFDMSVITDNMPVIDAALGKAVPTVSGTVDNDALEDVYEGVVTGVIAAEITGGSDMYGVVRAYRTNFGLAAYMQICELWNGTRLSRHYLNGSWSGWEASGGGGGGSYTKTLLYDSGNNVTGAPVGSTIELLDNLSNYDQGIVMCSTPSDRNSVTPLSSSQFFFDVDYVLNDAAGVLHLAEYGYRWCQIAFTDSTFTVDNAGSSGEGSGYNLTVYKIYGIKF